MIWKINGRALSASGVKSADLPLDRCEWNETQIALPAHVVAVDDADIVDLTRLVLERCGYRVIAARSGAEALHKLQASRPNLILLDINMPEMDG